MISIIIPLYNKVRHVKRALDSVLAQTYKDFEVIVVNDGSTDGSERVVEGLSDSRIRLANREHRNSWGGHAARNLGIAQSHASLIALLDADDEWRPEHLATILRLTKTYPDCGMYATGRIVHKEDGSEAKLEYSSLPHAPWEGVIPSYFLVKGVQPICSSTCAVWRKVLEDVGHFPVGERHGGDLDTWCRIALKYRVAFSTYYGAITYSDTDNSVSRNISTPIYGATIATLTDVLRDGCLPTWVRREDVLDYRNQLVLVAARSGLVNLRGYAATARGMLQSAWATRRLRAAVVFWYLLSVLPGSVVSSLWGIAVASGRNIKRTFGFPR